MDLLEKKGNAKRHPWETARVKSIRQILRRYASLPDQGSFLDIGSGDGFAIDAIFKDVPAAAIHGVDIHLSDQQIRESNGGRVQFFNRYERLNRDGYDGIFLLDVIEHASDDATLLKDVKGQFLKAGGFAVITVPAFQSLFSSYDTFLKHYRRYHLKQLKSVIQDASFDWVAGGYLFSSLLPMRAANCILERIFPSRKLKYFGLGDWQHNDLVTRTVEGAWNLDNATLLYLARHNIFLPGLSVWAIVRNN